MQIAAIVMMVYGAFILVGGVMGAAASVIALVMGVDLWWSGHRVWLGFAWSTEVKFFLGVEVSLL